MGQLLLFNKELSFVTVDNPAEHAGNPEVWSLFGKGFYFRVSEYRRLWPALAWLDGADLTACHCFALYKNEVVGAVRYSPFNRHAKYKTMPGYRNLILSQAEPVRSRTLEAYDALAAEHDDFRDFCELGQLIIHPRLRASRLGVTLNVRQVLIAYVVHSIWRLGYRKLLTLTHEEVNSHRYIAPLGFRHIDCPDLLRHPNGTTSRLMILEELDPEYRRMLRSVHRTLNSQERFFTDQPILEVFGDESLETERKQNESNA